MLGMHELHLPKGREIKGTLRSAGASRSCVLNADGVGVLHDGDIGVGGAKDRVFRPDKLRAQ
jgi:predicted Zn-dependent protease